MVLVCWVILQAHGLKGHLTFIGRQELHNINHHLCPSLVVIVIVGLVCYVIS